MAVYYQDAYRIEKDDTLTGCRFGDCCLECPRERCKYERNDERAQRSKVDLMRKRYWRVRKRRRRGMTQQAIAIDPRHPEIIYAGTHLCGSETVWRSVDGGATWKNITSNLPRLAPSGFSISPLTGELFKSGCDGTYVLPPPYDEGKDLVYYKCIPLDE